MIKSASVATVCLLAIYSHGEAYATNFIRLYATPEYPNSFDVRSISALGERTYLTAYPLGQQRSYRRDSDGGMRYYADAPHDSFEIYATSYDGATVVGTSKVALSGGGLQTVAHVYQENVGYVSLGAMQGYQYSYAVDVSYDGHAVIGRGYTPPLSWGIPAISRPFYWTPQSGRIDLPQAFADSPTNLVALSSDGQIAAGHAGSYEGGYPITWSPTTGYTFLPIDAINGGSATRVGDMSKDGSTIIGSAISADGQYTLSCYWDSQRVLRTISDGWLNMNTDVVNGDGSVIVGSGISPGPNGFRQAWIFTLQTGVVPLTEYLRSHGVDIASDEIIVQVRSISDDGNTFGGVFKRTSAFTRYSFIASIPQVPSPNTLALLALSLTLFPKRRRTPLY